MILEIGIGVAAFAVGFVTGESYKGDKTTQRLRKRGYFINKERGGYYSNDKYQFIYNGFDHKMNPVRYVGQVFYDYDDAVANADEHYYRRMVSNGDKTPIV